MLIPADRCRHGRTSSRHRWTSPTKNIYAREDQAIVFLARADITVADLPTILETHQLVIWCDHLVWRLEIDGNTVIEQAPPRPGMQNTMAICLTKTHKVGKKSPASVSHMTSGPR